MVSRTRAITFPRGSRPLSAKSMNEQNCISKSIKRWKMGMHSPLGGSSVQMSSRQTSGSAHSTEMLQKTQGAYLVQLSPRHTAQRVQLPAATDDGDLSADASEILEGGDTSVPLPVARMEEKRRSRLPLGSLLPDEVRGMTKRMKTARNPSLVATFNMADDEGSGQRSRSWPWWALY